ncbi:MAG: SatD family protein [Planctomycetota bacterium]
MSRIVKKGEVPYVALIADLVASRALDDRAAVQERLRASLAAWSRRLARSTVAPLALTAGDEFEGLFHDPGPVFDVVRGVTDDLGPVRIRFGLGLGALATAVPSDRRRRRVAELDGPAFHAARDALDRASDRGLWMAFSGWGDAQDGVLEGLGELLGVLRDQWTEKQARTVLAARDAPQKDVAAAFGVSPSVVSESLKAARFEAVLRAEDALARGIAAFANMAP